MNQHTLHTPPIHHRWTMAYRTPPDPRQGPTKPAKTAAFRRILFFVLVAASMALAFSMISKILRPEGLTPLKWVIVGIFTVLFGWISITFWTALVGFNILMAGWGPFTTSALAKQGRQDIFPSTSIAVIMPVYNEDVPHVFAGLRVMYESLQGTAKADQFSFFVLSDSDDPGQCEQEERAWEKLCQEVRGFGRIFYRRRRLRIHKKSGNIADFCRRWGSEYKYMIVLDADSLMSGQLMKTMVEIMESRTDIGILQTVPRGIDQKSLVSRINQFISHVYGPLLLTGSYFWQLDEAGFWGHNAIVRLAPFMKFCGLPKLSGSLPFGGEILSHDFVEAALMRRAGWGVWLAYDLQDSYEGLPPDLGTELERDCRWCRGNIQHLRLLFMKGVTTGHRMLFLNGNMFYFSSFLWLLLLVLMTVYAISGYFHKPQYFPAPHSLFPSWPVQYRHLSMELLVVTAVLLFLPKVLSVILLLTSRQAHLYGGVMRLLLSVVLETVFSIFLAPIRMFFHSWFFISSFFGGKFEWTKQSRSNGKVSFSAAFKAYWLGSVVAFCWAVLAFVVDHTLFLWLCAICIPLMLAVPFSMLMGHVKAGAFFKRLGLFLTPVETNPTQEILRYEELNSVAL